MSHLRGPTCDAGANQQLAVGAVEAPSRAFVVTQMVKMVR
jgi:hypothetical protein